MYGAPGSPVDPVFGAGAEHAALGADHQILGVGMQRAADDALVVARTVRVGGIDKVDAELVHGMTQYPDRRIGIDGIPPHARPGQMHGAVADAV